MKILKYIPWVAFFLSMAAYWLTVDPGASYCDRIYRAKVREYEYDSANGYASQLETHARAVQIDDAVILMKKVVPEFISKHSIFEKFDKKS